jgi:hypothetical protein
MKLANGLDKRSSALIEKYFPNKEVLINFIKTCGPHWLLWFPGVGKKSQKKIILWLGLCGLHDSTHSNRESVNEFLDIHGIKNPWPRLSK